MKSLHPLLLSLLLAISTLRALCSPTSLVKVEVFVDGSAHVVYTFPTNGSAVIDLRLIGQPDPNFLVLVQNERGELLTYAINETSSVMTIIAINSTQVTVDYYTQTITSKVGGRWVVNFTTPLPAVVKLPPNATLSALYVIPASIATEGQSIVLTYPAGPVKLAYILPPAVKTQPKPPPQTQPPSNASQVQQPPPQVQQEKGQPQGFSPLFYGLAAVTAAVVVAYFLLRRREAGERLSEVDVQILNILKQSGGGLFQSELASLLGLPITTVWRHVKKLESRGLVVVEKRTGRNFVKLTRTV
ncbi:winged helix-turn-helix transcriptional regulator [Infirmifilum lucidum]|uniref:Winged helix-turn-helix transcriptional regulator n=1 Tax=Infirmifilum lucidum TaxID=2776706 RepID=A0A7L9FJN0_9CREN|nr:winged helix-turn-helix transcriptional regulator [Infirmifilum lucidum]QOJ79223.1 winged helix-turn-helix transcriptional regulator [Infirmifilum lucidum]